MTSQNSVNSHLCNHCPSISIDVLLHKLADPSSDLPLQRRGTHHHDSLRQLGDCALAGCRLCCAVVAQAPLQNRDLPQTKDKEQLVEALCTVYPSDVPIYITLRKYSGNRKVLFHVCRAPQETPLNENTIAILEFEAFDPGPFVKVKRDCNSPSPEPPSLPTRVIDVGDDTTPPRLVSGYPAKGHWVALSHCWGGKVDNVTVKANLDAKKRAMPLDELPPSFRDAVIITRQLGMQYLWIDALCIIQDSMDVDWPKEAAKMGHYYTHSIMTVSATNAENSTQGILQRREPLFEPVKLWLRSETLGWEGDVYLREDDNTNAARSESPYFLDNRGWCLQEKCLPPRTLTYSKLGLKWECLKLTEGEWEHTGSGIACIDKVLIRTFLAKTLEGRKNTVPASLHPTGNRYTGVGASGNWTDLMQEYSRRHLSYPSDKLAAVSGLASLFAQALPGDEYLAGLWRSGLLHGLSWTVPRLNGQLEPALPRPAGYRAPSWSWASVDGPVHYRTVQTASWPKDLRDDVSMYPGMATVLDAAVERDPRDPDLYGRVSGGYIRLRALWLAVHLHVDDFPELRSGGHPSYLCFGLSEVSRPDPSDLWADHTRAMRLPELDDVATRKTGCACRAWGELDAALEPGEQLLDGSGRFCLGVLMLSNRRFLLLQPSKRFPGTFQRVGCADFNWIRSSRKGGAIRFDGRFIKNNMAEVVIT
ncbi:hypothetical protein RB595_000079 [Gaeumannomyces hyphopodioides]